MLQLEVFKNKISASKIYHTNFILTWNNHWYDFAFCSALLSSLFCLSWRQESFFLPLIVISGSLTCQALLVLHLCRFQQLQHLYYWHHRHHHHRHHFCQSHLIYITALFSKISATRGWTVEVAMDRKYCLYGQEKIVQWLTKILETEKRATI